jgi:hypothetical protein
MLAPSRPNSPANQGKYQKKPEIYGEPSVMYTLKQCLMDQPPATLRGIFAQPAGTKIGAGSGIAGEIKPIASFFSQPIRN